MPDVQIQNFLLATSNDQFSAIWKLTRAMKTAGWRYKASTDGSAQKDSSGNPNSDIWGGGGTVQTGGGGFTIGAPTTTAYGGRSTVSSLPGGTFAASSVGHYLKIVGATNSGNNGTFLITNFISATSVKIENPNAVPETVGVGGGQSYTELSALTDSYVAGNYQSGAWWCAQGPSTMKVPIGSNVPTGTFIRGENVSQSGSGATGEVLGVVTDTLTGQGYLVIAPRLSGTGSGPRGWSPLVTSTITGSRSGATVNPSGSAVVEFVREIVFWKDSLTNGHIYFQVIDQASEATPSATGTGRFSQLAALASATFTICPGGSSAVSPASNGFPTIGTYVPSGQGGSNVASTGSKVWAQGTVNLGKCQLLVTNCIEDANVSPDGTWIFSGGQPPSTTAYAGFGFFRVDDQEDGDVDPYVWWIYDTRISNSRSRTLGNNTQIGDTFVTANIVNGTPFLGWRRRGYITNGVQNGDSWLEMQGGFIGNTSGYYAGQNTATAERVACALVTVTPREPIWVFGTFVNNGVPQKIRKGTLRWMFMVQGNASNDTYDTKRWIQMSSTNFPLVIGPADGTTTPVNQ